MAAKLPNPRDPVSFQQLNPKNGKSKAGQRYELYKSARTVEEAKKLGASNADLTYDLKKGFMKLDSSSAPVPAAGIAGLFPGAQPSRSGLSLGQHAADQVKSSEFASISSASSSGAVAPVSQPRSDPGPGGAQATAHASRDDNDLTDEVESVGEDDLAPVLQSPQQRLPPQQVQKRLTWSRLMGTAKAVTKQHFGESPSGASPSIFTGASHSAADESTVEEPSQKKRQLLYGGRHVPEDHDGHRLAPELGQGPSGTGCTTSPSTSSSTSSFSGFQQLQSLLRRPTKDAGENEGAALTEHALCSTNQKQRMIDLSEGNGSGDTIKVVCRLGIVKKEPVEEPCVPQGCGTQASVHEKEEVPDAMIPPEAQRSQPSGVSGMVAANGAVAADSREASAEELSKEQQVLADQAREREEFEAAQAASYEAAHEEKKRKEENERELLQKGSLEPLEVLDGKFMQGLYGREKILNALVCDTKLRLALFRYLRIRRRAAKWYGPAVEDYFKREERSLMEALDEGQQDCSVESFNNEKVVLEAAQQVEDAVFAMPTPGRFVPELFAPLQQAEVDAAGKMVDLDDGLD